MVSARNGGRGFTIIEVLVVTALSFIGLLGLVAMQVAAVRGSSQSRAVTEAVGLAQDKLEALAHAPLSSLASASEASLGPQGVAATGGLYTRATTVAVAAGVTSINVAVSWSDTFGHSHTVRLQTARAP